MQLMEYILQPTAALKTPLKILFLKGQKEKNVLKFQKFLKNIAKLFFFPDVVGLQPRMSDLRKKRSQEKCFLSVFLKSKNFAIKGSILKFFD